MSRKEHVFKGKCWKLGDNIANDGGLMHLRYVTEQEWNPDILKKHCLENVDPEIPKSAKAGDILVAGKRFGHGNPHIQGFLGLKGLGVGLLTESIPRGPFRVAINAGVYVLPNCPGITKFVEPGDLLEVDFAAGVIQNLSRGKSMKVEPIPEVLLEILAEGGGLGYLKKALGA
jgi:3-isopropylmalate/(R)-2-methylmalate dehydratase small subunit